MAQYPTISAGQWIRASTLRSMLPEYAVKGTDTPRAATTSFSDDPDLTLAVVAAGVYLVEFHIMFAGLSAANIKTAWSVPSGTTGNRRVRGPGSTVTDANADNIAGRYGVHSTSGTVIYSCARNSATNQQQAIETAYLTIGATAGSVALQWAQNASNATATTVTAGSFMRLTRIG